MAKLRSINTGIWDDEYFCDLSRDERLLFVYFLTNRLTNMAGAYKIPRRIIRQDTGFNDTEIDTILGRLEKDHKAVYRDGWIVLSNFLKNQSLNDNMKKGVISEISDAPTWVAFKVITIIKSSRTLSKAFEPFQRLISDVETLRKDELEREREYEKESEEEVRGDTSPDSSWEWPMQPFMEAFASQLEGRITPDHVGRITSTVTDMAAWDSTIQKYKDNFDPFTNSYLPSKIGNVLDVYRSEVAKLEKENAYNNRTTTHSRGRNDNKPHQSLDDLKRELGVPT